MKLFIDSATNYLYLAIIDGKDNPYFVRSGRFDHSETLVDFLKSFLENNNYKAEDIDSVFIGRGPGSYTGIRICGTVGKVLSFLTNVKLYSFSSLDLIIAGSLEKDGTYIAHIDAKKNASYYKVVEIKNREITVLQDEEFGENTCFDAFKNATLITMNDSFFENGSYMANKILEHKLYKEESNLDYTPNYLRNVI